MASVSVSSSYNSDQKKITWSVVVSDLQPGQQASRRLSASITPSGASISPAAASVADNGPYTFVTSGVEAGTNYTASFDLQWYKESSGSWESTTSGSGSYTVPGGRPSIQSMSVSQVSAGLKQAYVAWTTDKTGCSYTIKASQDGSTYYNKDSGTMDSTSGRVTIQFNNFRPIYYVRIEVSNSSGSDSKDSTVAIKPERFKWTSNISPGAEFKVSAIEWTKLQDAIDNAREYRGVSTGGSYPTPVSSGADFSHNHYNECSRALRGIGTNPESGLPYYGAYICGRKVESDGSIGCTYGSPWEFNAGDPIFAAALIQLAAEVNVAAGY